MLNPALPDEVALAKIPRQRWKSVLEIVAFTEFQGFFIIRRVHLAAQVLNVAFWVFNLIWGFATGDAFIIIAYLIFTPFLLIVFALFYRLLSEIAVSILLIPVLLAQQQAPTVTGAGGNDADLAAYGVGVDQEMGTTV